jgi:predicted transporter
MSIEQTAEINPNNKYFNKRRKLATLSLLLSSFVCFLGIFILKPYSSNPEIAKYIGLIVSVEAIKDGILVALYLVIATIHDISFEKIANLVTDVAKIKK